MIQAGDGAGLALEALTEVGVFGQMGRQNLDGYGAVEPGVFGLVDLTHPPRSQGRQDFVRTKFSTRGERNGGDLLAVKIPPHTAKSQYRS